MPYRLWRHVCHGREIATGSPDCQICGTHGVFAGWRLSMWEAARVYRYVYELEPVGPHRPLADRLLAPLRTPCIRCHGEGVLAIDEGTWCACATCEGTGGIWNRSPEDVDAARRQVLTASAAPTSVRLPEKKPARTPRRRRTGFSSHGLRFSDVERAFAEAERLLGGDWKLRGRGHCRRATLDPRYSSHARKGAARSSAEVFIIGGPRRKRVMPLAIIEKAAELLGVTPGVFVCREY